MIYPPIKRRIGNDRISIMQQTHTQHLKHALALAYQKKGSCAPNPSVGAVVVKNGQVIATAYHQAAGQAHAEVIALQQLSPEQAQDTSVYVTLEPCCHQGKTPPCTNLLIQRGVKAVYYGLVDPNPLVSGQGHRQLQAAGIECTHLPLPEITEFYNSYLYWTRLKRPFVTAKLAMSLDGKIAGFNGERVDITGSAAQLFTHQYRQQVDAILTTVRTVLLDDPQLNVRLATKEAQQKIIYVLDKNLQFPPHAKLLNTAKKLILFHQEKVLEKQKQFLESQGIRCVAVPLTNDKMDMNAVLAQIGQDGMHDLLLEAGGRCFESCMLDKQIQRAFVYIALKWLGPDAQLAFAHKTTIFDGVRDLKWHVLGQDIVGEFTPAE
jgi:diaminohydroxyphosphoribosylaminopyrimidine deaminase/5-amino-6-(5-phosphoribosylamino)uracil reductase